MRISFLLLCALFVPHITLAATTGYYDKDAITNLEKDYGIEVSHDKQTAEAIVFAPWFDFINKVQSWWSTFQGWFNWKQIRVSLCQLNALVIAKTNVGFTRNVSCP